ncbi:MAG: DEAD/DEAH box helicase, partial [Stellaceae bacterium]
APHEARAPRERRDDRPRAPAPVVRQPEPEAPRFAQSRPVRPEDGLEVEVAAAPIALAAHREGARPHRDGGARDSRVIGFGDDLPAFLRRPVRVAGA